MNQRSAPKRRRCCECREFYQPSPSAAKTQKTCSEKCRLERRAGQERHRYQAEPAAHRQLGRARQEKYRTRRKATEGADPPPVAVPVDLLEYIERRLARLEDADRQARDKLEIELRAVARRAVRCG